VKAIAKLPDDLPAITDLIDKRPTAWLGRPIEWSNNEKPIPVFIERFAIADTDCEWPVFLFGARYDLSQLRFRGKSPTRAV
jgi:hypothetical protein